MSELRLQLPDGDRLDVCALPWLQIVPVRRPHLTPWAIPHPPTGRCPVRADLIEVWQRLPWWEQACDAWPSLVEDADSAAQLAMAAAYEKHVESRVPLQRAEA